MRPPSDPARSARDLDALLRDLGPQLRRGAPPTELSKCLPTGLPELDRLLAGGFPQGRLSEITGRLSSGRTSLALTLLARATRAEEVVAVVDGSDAFDPASARAAGVALERVLWVRAPELREVWRSAHKLLEARGFALVLLDLTDREASPTRATWTRLARAAGATATALIVSSSQRVAGTCAALSLEIKPARAHFTGTPALLEALETEVALVRHRTAAGERSARVRLRSPAVA